MKHSELIQKVRKFSRPASIRSWVDSEKIESTALEAFVARGIDLSDMDNPDGFLWNFVKNISIDLQRKEMAKHATPVPEFYDNMVGGVYDHAEFDGVVERVRQHVSEILANIEGDTRRKAASAYYIHGLPTRQVATLMELPKGTVGRLLYEARKQLEEDQLSDVLVWDDFNRVETQYNNRNYGEGASEGLIAILRDEGFLR